MTKKPTSQDWHQADIVAAIHKSGNSLQRLSRLHGYASNTLNQAFIKPYPKCEHIIASHLGITPQTIWPSRYNLDGTPKSGRGERGIGRHTANLIANSTKSLHAKKALKVKKQFIPNSSTTKNVCNVNDTAPIKQMRKAA